MQLNSVLFRSLAAVCALVLGFVLLTGVVVYQHTQEVSLASADEHLAGLALGLARAEVAVSMPRVLTLPSAVFERRLKNMNERHHHGTHRYDIWDAGEVRQYIERGERVLIRQLSQQGRAVPVRLNQDLYAGFSNLMIKGEEHRVFTVFLPNGRYTAVSEPLSFREAIAEDAARQAVMPMLILLPVLLGVITAVLMVSFSPIRRLSQQLRCRMQDDLQPISTRSVPVEISVFVKAVNQMLENIQSLRAREIRFIADAAHELRSPLTALTLQAEQLGRSKSLTPSDRTLVKAMQEGLQRSEHQLSQMLHLSRLQADEIARNREQEPKEFDLSEVLAEIMEGLMPGIDQRSLHLSVQGLEALPLLPFSKSCIHAILRNLIENAVKYTPQGGDVEVKFESDSYDLKMTVSNSGDSIAEADRNHLFKPFYRCAGTGQSGTGLGLAIVKRCADQLRATISLDSIYQTPPGGVRICVSIPWPSKYPQN